MSCDVVYERFRLVVNVTLLPIVSADKQIDVVEVPT